MFQVFAMTLVALSWCSPQEEAPEGVLLGSLLEGVELEGEPLVAPDGTEHPNRNFIVWSPDGTQFAYIGLRGSKSVAVLGESELGEYHFANPPIFGATGEQVAFRVGNRKKNNKSEEWWLLDADGKAVIEEDWIGTPVFSPDGSKLAVWTQPGARIESDGSYSRGGLVFAVASSKKGKWTVKRGKKFDDGRALLPPVFAADSSLVGTLASDDGEWFVLTSNGKREKPFGKETWSHVSDFALSSDGKRLALSATDASKSDMPDFPGMKGMTFPGQRNTIISGKARFGEEYDNAGRPVFAPSGKQVAFKVQRESKMGIAIDGDKHANTEWDFVFAPIFSPNGKRFCYVACNGYVPNMFFGTLSLEAELSHSGGKSVLVVEDTRRKKKAEILTDEFSKIADVTWDAEGERIAYRAETSEGWVAICGSTRSAAFEEMGPPRFSADGTKLHFGVRSGREVWWKTIALE